MHHKVVFPHLNAIFLELEIVSNKKACTIAVIIEYVLKKHISVDKILTESMIETTNVYQSMHDRLIFRTPFHS